MHQNLYRSIDGSEKNTNIQSESNYVHWIMKNTYFKLKNDFAKFFKILSFLVSQNLKGF